MTASTMTTICQPCPLLVFSAFDVKQPTFETEVGLVFNLSTE